MVFLHPSNFNNAIAILNNLKTSKKDTRLRGDVYLLIKNTCKNEKHVFSIRRANCHRTNVIRFQGLSVVFKYEFT